MKLSEKIAKCTACKGTVLRVTRPTGNRKSGVAFVLPAPTEEQCNEGHLALGENFDAFSTLLRTYANFDMEQQACLVPLTFCSTKMNIKCTTNCRPFIDEHLVGRKLVIFVGNIVYKAFFKQGTIPEILYGNDFEDQNNPWRMFFFSDYRELYYARQGVYDGNQVYWENRIKTEVKSFGKFLLRFKKELSDGTK